MPKVIALDNHLDRIERSEALGRQLNSPEASFARLAAANGWRPSKRGWPDFLAFGPTGEIIAVEVKPNLDTCHLKVDQTVVMDFLQSKGVRCFVSDGTKLEKYDRKKHGTRRTLAETA